MKKPTPQIPARTTLPPRRPSARRPIDPSELAKVRGGDGEITAMDDWEARK